jgi:hypothetical protein
VTPDGEAGSLPARQRRELAYGPGGLPGDHVEWGYVFDDHTTGPDNRASSHSNSRQDDAPRPQPGIVFNYDGTVGNRREASDPGVVGVRGSHQRNAGCNADPIANGDVAPLGKLLDNDQVVCDVDLVSNAEAAKPQHSDPGTGEECVSSPPLEDFFSEAPGKTQGLTRGIGTGPRPAGRRWQGDATRLQQR